MTKPLQQCFLFLIVVVIPGHNLGNSQVSVNRTIGPTLVLLLGFDFNANFIFYLAITLAALISMLHYMLQDCKSPNFNAHNFADIVLKCLRNWHYS